MLPGVSNLLTCTVQQLQSAADADRVAANAEFQSAMDSLAAAEASGALQGDAAPSADVKSARKRVSSAREALDSVTARRTGLTTVLNTQAQKLTQAEAELRAESEKWAMVILDDQHKQTLSLVAQLRRRLQEHATAIAAVNSNTKFPHPLSQWLGRFFAPDATNPSRNMLGTSVTVQDETGAWREAVPWAVDDLNKLFDAMSQPRVLAEKLAKELTAPST